MLPRLSSTEANGGNSGADIDYGPRGPQHRGNMLLR